MSGRGASGPRAESIAIGYGGDALVSAATGLARRDDPERAAANWRQGVTAPAGFAGPVRGVRPSSSTQPGLTAALEQLVEPLTRGDPTSPLRWTCKSRAKLTAALTKQGWRGEFDDGRPAAARAWATACKSVRKSREGTSHPDRNAQFEHINATAAAFLQDAANR